MKEKERQRRKEEEEGLGSIANDIWGVSISEFVTSCPKKHRSRLFRTAKPPFPKYASNISFHNTRDGLLSCLTRGTEKEMETVGIVLRS